jgi:flagellar hook-associated protein 1 FlgK
MPKIHSMMDIGKRSMMNSQTALQTVAHNIANKTTEGYSRQRVDLRAAPPVGEGRLQIGMGSRAAQVTRVNNPFLDKQVQKETHMMGFYNGQSEALARVEGIFNEQGMKGLNQYMADFFNSFRELSNNPESTTSRTVVKEAAEALVKDFQRVDSQLVRVQEEINTAVKSQVNEINKMAQELAVLNEKISMVEVQGAPANDERDRREVLLKQLNEKIDIRTAEGDNGMVTVSTAGNAILVSGYDAMELGTYSDPKSGQLEILYKGNGSNANLKITDRIKGGELGGSLAVRDQVVPDLLNKVDEIADRLANEVNRIHLQGFDRGGRTGNIFFTFEKGEGTAARNIQLADGIREDVNRIAAAARLNAPGDNTTANVISQLQYKQVMDGGVATLDDYYNSQVGKIGVIVSRANKMKEAQGNIVQQVNTLRESVSGVSLDEEATKMLEFQKMFDASARVIKTADEMLDTVLSLKRM